MSGQGVGVAVEVGGIKKKTKQKKKKNLYKMEHWLSSAQVRKARNIKGKEEEGG